MALIIERVALGLPDNIAITHRFARSVALKEDWDKRPCQTVVIHTVSRTTCCKHRHTASMGVQEQLFTSRNQEGIVVFCKLTSGSIDKGQFIKVVEGIDVGIGKHILTCQALDATMAVIEEGQSALLESTHQVGIGALVDGTTRSACQRIGATIHLFCGQCRTNGIHHHIMFLAVIHIIHLLVVGQEQQIRFPFAMRFSQIVVMFDLAQHILSLFHSRHRDTSHTNVDASVRVGAFVIVHHGKEIIGCETQLILWVFKRFVSRHIILPIAFDIAEIERCTSKQGQILQLASAAPIHHANKVAYACRVGRARRKFVIDLIHIDHHASQAVLFGMIIGQGLCLLEKDGRSEDQVIGFGDGVKVLIGQGRPAHNPMRRLRLEQNIAFFRPLIGGKYQVASTQHDILNDRLQR